VQIVESRQGLKNACLEEIALNLGYIGMEQMRAQAKSIANTDSICFAWPSTPIWNDGVA